LPIYIGNAFYQKKEIELAKDINLLMPKKLSMDDLRKKEGFCSFVYSNYLADENRKIFFEKLSKYKKISSGGKYLNNLGYNTDNKLEFESKHKFSIAFENSSRSGYTTEKIVCSLMANTIPIYWGNPEICREFNSKRFINCHEYSTFEDVIKRIEEIDNNDELYLKIINEPVYAEGFNPNKISENFEKFLKNIFDQDLLKAKRRTINPARARDLEKNERLICKINKLKNFCIRTIANIYSPFKKIKTIENIKQRILSAKK